jgi:hypothetical protein
MSWFNIVVSTETKPQKSKDKRILKALGSIVCYYSCSNNSQKTQTQILMMYNLLLTYRI